MKTILVLMLITSAGRGTGVTSEIVTLQQCEAVKQWSPKEHDYYDVYASLYVDCIPLPTQEQKQ